ncbi:hypothetical protein A5N83_27075 [Rhodococcus sp. 1139]|nr:hypothetical protein A5N83_27075 [Rhodococcus sp. 1139]
MFEVFERYLLAGCDHWAASADGDRLGVSGQSVGGALSVCLVVEQFVMPDACGADKAGIEQVLQFYFCSTSAAHR